jgi:hypothetical protein
MLLSELFEQVLERPAMYVGQESVVRISAFVEGYWYAKWACGEDVRDDLYRGFTAWTAKRFRIESAHSWEDIILFMALGESRAYEMTVELWGEYKAQYQARARKRKSARKR